MTYFFNICMYVDIFIIVFYLPYYCNIRYVVLSFDEIKTHYYYYNHNYNKILKSDWFSTALISALIGQFNRTVRVMPK